MQMTLDGGGTLQTGVRVAPKPPAVRVAVPAPLPILRPVLPEVSPGKIAVPAPTPLPERPAPPEDGGDGDTLDSIDDETGDSLWGDSLDETDDE
jgi:hypothetical protein